MVVPGSQLPPLSGGRENSASNINERILDANHDVRQLLMHISSNNTVKIPRPVFDFLKSTQDLTSDLIKNPIGQDWKQQFEQLRQECASNSPAAPTKLIHDRQIIVKLGDSDGVRRFRTSTPTDITKLAEKARLKAAKEIHGLTMASAKFVAARQLKSGYLSLSLRTAKEAEIMRCHRQVWVKHLWKGSEVRLPS
jgi:hypothetical protein